MNYFSLSVVSGYSILPAVIIGLVRFKIIDKAYRPFITICVVALCNELTSMLMIHIYKTNAVNANIYVLVEFALYCWQFRCWNSLSTKSWHFLTVISFMSSIWVYENILTGEITSFNSLFRICASFCIIFLSIDQVNRLIAMARGNLFRNSLFLICMGLIIFFSYKSVIEVFYLLRLPLSDVFYDNIFFLLTLINIFVNLIFAIAVLWIPTKQKFILPY